MKSTYYSYNEYDIIRSLFPGSSPRSNKLSLLGNTKEVFWGSTYQFPQHFDCSH